MLLYSSRYTKNACIVVDIYLICTCTRVVEAKDGCIRIIFTAIASVESNSMETTCVWFVDTENIDASFAKNANFVRL